MRSELATVNLNRIPAAERELVLSMFDDINGLVQKAADAAKKWVQLTPETQEIIIEGTAAGQRETWKRLERIGHGLLAPALLYLNGNAARYLSRLPLDAQEHYLHNRVPVLVNNRMVNKDITEMSSLEVRQVFRLSGDSLHIRSAREQRTWLEGAGRRLNPNQLTKIHKPGKWSIEAGKAKILAALNGELTVELARELVRDLRRCTPNPT